MGSEWDDDEAENWPEADDVERLRLENFPEAPVEATFDRAISQDFIETLKAEKLANGWWRDVLSDKNLVIAPRGKFIDIYWLGMRLFHVECVGGVLTVSTHEKYLLNPTLKGQVSLKDGVFRLDNPRDDRFLGTFTEGTLKSMKSAAALYTGIEKSGCHEISIRNSSVIDCEIAFPRSDAGRVDIAALESFGRDVRLVFWEAKKFKNTELRSNQGAPLVCAQISKYREYVTEHQKEILESYTAVVKNLIAFHGMGWKRRENPSALLEAVASGAKRLIVGDQPKVGLLIFDFDTPQREDQVWRERLQILRENADISDVIAVGDPKGLKLPNER